MVRRARERGAIEATHLRVPAEEEAGEAEEGAGGALLPRGAAGAKESRESGAGWSQAWGGKGGLRDAGLTPGMTPPPLAEGLDDWE